jgi:hypothetical protein
MPEEKTHLDKMRELYKTLDSDYLKHYLGFWRYWWYRLFIIITN